MPITIVPDPVLISPWNFNPTRVRIDWSAPRDSALYLSIDGAGETSIDVGTRSGQEQLGQIYQTVEVGRTYTLSLKLSPDAKAIESRDLVPREKLALPRSLVRVINARAPLFQGITNLRVLPGPEFVHFRFRTRQPVVPVVGVLEELNDAWTLVGVAVFSSNRLATEHDVLFARGSGLTDSLKQQTVYQFRIAAPGTQGKPGRAVTGKFKTGARRATVHFERFHVFSDGDSGTSGAGDFRLLLGAFCVDGLGDGTRELDAEVSSGEVILLGQSIYLPSVSSTLVVQALVIEDDTPVFGSFMPVPELRLDHRGSSWGHAYDREFGRVSAELNLSTLSAGDESTIWKLASGPLHLHFDIHGSVDLTVIPGTLAASSIETTPYRHPVEPKTPRRVGTLVGGERVWVGARLESARVIQLVADGSLYHARITTGSEPRWTRVEGVAGGEVSAADYENELHLFAVSQEGDLQHAVCSDEVSGVWRRIESPPLESVAVNVNSGGLDLWALDRNGRLLHAPLDAARPLQWTLAGEGLAPGSMTLLRHSTGGIVLVALTRDRNVVSRRSTVDGAFDRDWETLAKAPHGDFSAELVDDGALLLAVVDEEERVQVMLVRENETSPDAQRWKTLGSIEDVLNAGFSVYALLKGEAAAV